MIDRTMMQNALWALAELRSYVTREDGVLPETPWAKSVQNMRHYLRLRLRDNTDLQNKLSVLGLSSLGRSQPHVVQTLNRVHGMLSSVLQEVPDEVEGVVGIEEAGEIFAKRCLIFGGREEEYLYHARTRIMLTLPTEAAHEEAFIREMAVAGVNLFRINTAHDGPEVWHKMASHIAAVNEHLPESKRVRIYVDLAGPKIRTGSLKETTRAVTIVPSEGRGIVKILSESAGEQTRAVIGDEEICGVICVNAAFFRAARKAREIVLYSEGKKPRTLKVAQSSKGFLLCEISKKLELRPSSRLEILKGKVRAESAPLEIESQNAALRLAVGDMLLLTSEEKMLHLESDDLPAVACTDARALGSVKVGERVYLDDGKIALRVRRLREEGLVCEVISTTKAAVSLKAEKGINFPDTSIDVPAITAEDLANLEAVIDFADVIGISFAQTPEDIESVKETLRRHDRESIGIVAKIETKKAVRNLPALLENLLAWPLSGIMIARGDLAIEAGFENLAWLQEEILDLAEAAHMPVILATQILESQMKSNIPSRAEVIDAGFAQRAECVMLNKGAFAMDTIKKLEYILEQMHHVYRKNIQLLGPCNAWHELPTDHLNTKEQ